VIIEAQVQLYRAAEASGVKRFIPSDFSINLFNVPHDKHVFLGMRRTFHDRVRRDNHSLNEIPFLLN